MATKIYISGKISGIENEATELFAKAELELQAKGRVGSVVKIEMADWRCMAEQELMLKSATSFLITYEH